MISSLKIRLLGLTSLIYPDGIDSFETIKREKIHVKIEETLLCSETLPPECQLDIPFEFNLPESDSPSELMRTAVRIANLFPPSFPKSKERFPNEKIR